MIILADEFKILTEKDKEEFLAKAHDLIIVDIMMSCNQHFYNNLSSEEIGKAISIIYAQFEKVCKAEEDIRKRDEHYSKIGLKSYPEIDNDIDKQIFYLCSGFAEYCAGEDMKSENWEGKHFAAFKLAKGFVKSGIVAQSLKHYSVVF